MASRTAWPGISDRAAGGEAPGFVRQTGNPGKFEERPARGVERRLFDAASGRGLRVAAQGDAEPVVAGGVESMDHITHAAVGPLLGAAPGEVEVEVEVQGPATEGAAGREHRRRRVRAHRRPVPGGRRPMLSNSRSIAATVRMSTTARACHV
jgi:hypothetical protein